MGTVPIYRLPLLVLGFASLALGVAGGLVRLGAQIPAPAGAVALHGPLMVSGFLGTVIGLERAVALGRPWAYGAPLASGLGGLCLVFGYATAGFALLALAAALLVAASLAVLSRQPSLEMATLAAGAVAWLAGNLSLYAGSPAVPWWIAFFALTIGGERLELSRYLKRGPLARDAFIVLAAALLAAPLLPWALGIVLVLLALWLFVYDLARVTVRQRRCRATSPGACSRATPGSRWAGCCSPWRPPTTPRCTRSSWASSSRWCSAMRR
jgi:hypothetical protein